MIINPHLFDGKGQPGEVDESESKDVKVERFENLPLLGQPPKLTRQQVVAPRGLPIKPVDLQGGYLGSAASIRKSLIKEYRYLARAALEKDLKFKLHSSARRLENYRQAVADECITNLTGKFDTQRLCSEANRVEAIALPEPGKFRIITKGCGYLYTLLQPLQGEMIDAWKRCHASTMEDDDLTEMVNRVHANLPEHEQWLSIDYTAATDYLERRITYVALEALPPSKYRDLALLSLRGGKVVYKDVSADRTRLLGVGSKEPCLELDGSNGQLMGSPLSFPLLCLINLAVYEHTIDKWFQIANELGIKFDNQERFKLRWKRNVIINGDDLLCKGDSLFAVLHEKFAREAGLRYSAGKNYISLDTAMINSQLFYLKKDGSMARAAYLNQRILMKGGGGGGESLRTPMAMAVAYNKMAGLCRWTSCFLPEIMSHFDNWSFNSFVPNWYLPTHLGGYGVNLELANDGEVKITRTQRKMAARFVANPKLSYFFMKGIPPTLATDVLPQANWITHYGDDIPEEGYAPKREVQAWENRLMLLQYLGRDRKIEVKDFKLMIKRIKTRTMGLKPMSLEGLDKHMLAILMLMVSLTARHCQALPFQMEYSNWLLEFRWRDNGVGVYNCPKRCWM